VPQVGEFVTLDSLIEAHIRQVTARAESYEQAARILGIDKSTLYRWRKRLDSLEPSAVTQIAG
jgi:NtrC-family two-component system response regulator AlgB